MCFIEQEVSLEAPSGCFESVLSPAVSVACSFVFLLLFVIIVYRNGLSPRRQAATGVKKCERKVCARVCVGDDGGGPDALLIP